MFRALFQGKKAEPQTEAAPVEPKTRPAAPAAQSSQPRKVSQYSRGRGELLNVYPSISAASRRHQAIRHSGVLQR